MTDIESKTWYFNQIYSAQMKKRMYPYHDQDARILRNLEKHIELDGWQPVNVTGRCISEEILVHYNTSDLEDQLIWVERHEDTTGHTDADALQFKETWEMVGVRCAHRHKVDTGEDLTYNYWNSNLELPPDGDTQ